jgi:hypothetical protein
LEEAIVLAQFPDEVREELEETLFIQKNWPWKLIVHPLLEQEGVPEACLLAKERYKTPFSA